MPKILRIFNRLIIGGPIINATYLTRYLAPEYETLLLMGAKDPHEKGADHLVEHLGISYRNVPHMIRSVNPLNDWKAYKEIRQIIREFKPDIVHTHAAKPGALGRLAAAAEKVPVTVHTYHGHVFHSYFNPLKSRVFVQAEKYLARKTTAIIAISETQKKELAEDFRIAPADKFRIIPLGLDLDRFTRGEDKKRKQFREEFGVADHEIAIGIIGRLVPVKNHALFLQALHHVLENTDQKVKAFIIGDGELRGQLEKQAESLGIAFSSHDDAAHPHPLIFTSWRSDIDLIMAGLDIVALSSFNEGTPVSLIEAQAAQKPIVSTRVGGIADVVLEGRTALLSEIDDGEGFCENLLRLVKDEALRNFLVKDSRQHVLERYSYQRLVKDTAALYSQLLEENKS